MVESFRARSAATTPPPPEASGDAAQRLVWIDWLKVLVVAGVFVYHAAEPFLVISWVVSNDERSTVLSLLAGFGFLFGMPLMFLLTGATAWLSLGNRSLSSFGIVRVRRLLLPLIAGIAVLTPLQWWLAAAIDRGGENPLNTIAWFFGGMRFEPTPRWFGDYGMHLWFIGFLLAYSILCLPLLAALRGPSGARLLARLAGMPTPILLLLLLAPILVSQWLLRIPTPDYRDWADFALWLGFFAVGVVLVADRRLLHAVVRTGPRLLIAGVGLILAGVAVVGIALASGLMPAGRASDLRLLETAPVVDLPSVAYITVRTAAAAALTGACVWIGVRRFTSRPSWLHRANRAILPFYVLHHPVAVAVAAVVVQWSMGLWAKLAIVLVASLVGSLALTELAMRTDVGRAVFGIPTDTPGRANAPANPPPPSDPFAIHAGAALSVRDADRHRSIVAALQATARGQPEAEAIRWKEDGRWDGLTYAQLWDRIRHASLALQHRGIKPGDRVVIVSRSRPEWVVADFAALAAGAVVCPIYPGEADARIEQIAKDLRPRLICVEDERQLTRFGDIAPAVVLGPVGDRGSGAVTLAALERVGANADAGAVGAWQAGVDGLDRSDVATIVQTIDEEGVARGAVLTHGNVLHNIEAVRPDFPIGPGDVALSILPLSHMLERAAQLLAFTTGATIAFAESRIDRWADNMREVRPQAMAVVPLFLGHVVKGMRAASVERTGLVGRLARWSLATGAAARSHSDRSGRRRFGLRLAMADLLVLRPMRATTGGRLRYVCCGGAPLPVEVGEFLTAVGVPVVEGYGMTEASPLLAMNLLGRQRFGTVGPPVAGTELRIEAGTGEILARGPQVMQRYHQLPHQTAATLTPDGWLRTGDLGAWDTAGNLRLIGVRKDLLVLASGKKVSPRPMETQLEESGLIARAAVVNLGDDGIGLLVWPDPSLGGDTTLDSATAREAVIGEVKRLLGARASYERPRRLGLLPRDLSVDTGELLTNGRPNRPAVAATWGSIATIPLSWRSREAAHVDLLTSPIGAVSSAG